MNIVETTHDDPRTQTLIALQKAHASEHTPPKLGHAFEVGSENAARARFFLAISDGLPVGCVGLMALDDRAAEIKTMHVLEEMRGRGTGMVLLHHVFAVAKAEGVHQLKLETGSGDGFAASRRLYERAGFEHCAPWGAYTDDPFSYCMARDV